MRVSTLFWLTVVIGCGPGRPSESLGRAALLAQVDDGSTDRVRLIDFKKTDGQVGEMLGVKVYSMDFEGRGQLQQDALYKTSGPIETAIRTLETRPRPDSQGGMDQFYSQVVAHEKLACKGDVLLLRGKILFAIKESGWSPDQVEFHLTLDSTARERPCDDRGLANERLASAKNDLGNIMRAQEDYFSDQRTYAPDFVTLRSKPGATVGSLSSSPGNTVTLTGTSTGYTATVSNISTECRVQVGGGAAPQIDGIMVCSKR